jgi:hypothetical protein
MKPAQRRRRDAEDGAADRDRVGQEHVLGVDERRREEPHAEREIGAVDGEGAEGRRRVRHLQDDGLEDRDREQTADQLDERIARAHLRAAAPSATAEQEVREDRDVVVAGDRLPAAGAVRRRPHHAHLARHAVDDDVEEAAPDQSEKQDESAQDPQGKPRIDLDQAHSAFLGRERNIRGPRSQPVANSQ